MFFREANYAAAVHSVKYHMRALWGLFYSDFPWDLFLHPAQQAERRERERGRLNRSERDLENQLVEFEPRETLKGIGKTRPGAFWEAVNQ